MNIMKARKTMKNHALIQEAISRFAPKISDIKKAIGTLLEKGRRMRLSSISKLIGAGGNVESIDPKVYADALLEVHKKNSEMAGRSFKSGASFAGACGYVVEEEQRDSRGRRFGGSVELSRALFCSLPCIDACANTPIEKTVLFKYLKNEDVFQTFSTAKRSKRLIRGVSASEESKASMISRLKEAEISSTPIRSSACSPRGREFTSTPLSWML
ncbi:hypothetical protein D9757_013595 [Collybiopsis confluens]|uniref:Cullin family profile domain-containing protein n=1 Tax=Collybiopsis confluens TaxID=2823264 RepID=A0A8H5FPC6_9AGAR|nr:hypothetical protein D9757_015337 [Collybiopsis confluens]KAF5365858.1 hypothetical protein D9757_013975 [Collybiopsis confluens]KAF5366471.1 hypothetical protein D9757_013595 [Collybiopsis confluens]